MNQLIFLTVSSLLASSFAMAQTTAPHPSVPASTTKTVPPSVRHPHAVCLAGISRERINFAGAIDVGIQKGLIDPKERTALEKTLSNLMALEASASANRSISYAECKGIYQRFVAENTGIQMQMRANPFKAAKH